MRNFDEIESYYRIENTDYLQCVESGLVTTESGVEKRSFMQNLKIRFANFVNFINRDKTVVAKYDDETELLAAKLGSDFATYLSAEYKGNYDEFNNTRTIVR